MDILWNAKHMLEADHTLDSQGLGNQKTVINNHDPDCLQVKGISR